MILLSAAIFISGFLLAVLNCRFGWSALPKYAVLAGCVLLLTGCALWAEVLRENACLSRTVEIQRDQRLVDTDLYGVVRHPMYAAALLLFFSIPLVLGSLPSLAVFLGLVPTLVCRIKNEERALESGLEGYKDYELRVRFRLIPRVW